METSEYNSHSGEWDPSLDELIEAVRVMSDESVGKMMAANIDLSTLFGTSGLIKRAIGQGDDLIPHFSADFSSSLNAEELRCFQEIGEEWRTEKEQRIEREKASVELLQTMFSQIVETNRRISELNVQLCAVGCCAEAQALVCSRLGQYSPRTWRMLIVYHLLGALF